MEISNLTFPEILLLSIMPDSVAAKISKKLSIYFNGLWVSTVVFCCTPKAGLVSVSLKKEATEIC